MSELSAELLSNVNSILQQSRGGAETAAPEVEAAEPEASAEEQTAEATEPAAEGGESEPAPEAEKPLTASERAKFAQSLREAERAAASEAKLKKELEQLRADAEKAKGKTWKPTKEEFEKLASLYAEGKFPEAEEPEEKPLTPEQLEVKTLKEQMAALLKEKQEASDRAQYEDNLKAVATYIGDESPLHGMTWVPDKILSLYRGAEQRGDKPDVEKLTRDFEKSYVADVRGLFALPKMRKAIFSDDKLKSEILAELNGTTDTAAQQDSTPGNNVTKLPVAPKKAPSVITRKAAAERPAQRKPGEQLNDDELRAAAAAELKKVRGF